MTIGSIHYSCTFFKEIKWWVLSCPKTQHELYYLLHPEILYYCWVSVLLLNRLYLAKSYSGKAIFSSFVNIFWVKHASLNTSTHSFVNFPWLALVCHQKFDNWPLFKLGVLWFAGILNSFKTNILAQNQFQTMMTL